MNYKLFGKRRNLKNCCPWNNVKMQIPKILTAEASDHKMLTIVFTNGEKKYMMSADYGMQKFSVISNTNIIIHCQRIHGPEKQWIPTSILDLRICSLR
jgi:hypothetical protein